LPAAPSDPVRQKFVYADRRFIAVLSETTEGIVSLGLNIDPFTPKQTFLSLSASDLRRLDAILDRLQHYVLDDHAQSWG
jgi:hypothetical protein